MVSRHTTSPEERLEKDERHRAWYTPLEAVEKIQQWYSDVKGHETMQELKEVDGGKKAKKKQRKGGAMETALNAFADRYGWERS